MMGQSIERFSAFWCFGILVCAKKFCFCFRLTKAPVVWRQVFSQTSMAELRRKSRLLTAYTEHLLLTGVGQTPASEQSTQTSGRRDYVRIMTPSAPDQRGSQLSIWCAVHVGRVYQQLARRGVVVVCFDCTGITTVEGR